MGNVNSRNRLAERDAGHGEGRRSGKLRKSAGYTDVAGRAESHAHKSSSATTARKKRVESVAN